MSAASSIPTPARTSKLDSLTFDATLAKKMDKRAVNDYYANRPAPSRREDEVMDTLGELPTPDKAEKLVSLLRTKELRGFTVGVLNDVVIAVKSHDTLKCAEAVNDWVATGEEMVMFRRKRRHILAAREKADAAVKQAG